MHWLSMNGSSADGIIGTRIGDAAIITAENELFTGGSGFQGSKFVFGSFFGDTVDVFGKFRIANVTLEVQYSTEKAMIIKKAMKGLEQTRVLLFQALCKYLGENFRGIFLFAASGSTNFCRGDTSQNAGTQGKYGHWDYVDCSYNESDSIEGYSPGVIDRLTTFGITNPKAIFPYKVFCTAGANEIEVWENATLTNKSTRIIPAFVGGIKWPPNSVKYGSYDITFAESDWTFTHRTSPIAHKELYELTKVGGFIIITAGILKRVSSEFSGKVRILLDNPDGGFALAQKLE